MKDDHAIDAIVLVGHCGPDRWMLESAMRRFAPGVTVAAVDDVAALEEHVSERSLLLVNRVLDGRWPSDSGLDLIRQFASRDTPPRLMLISNYADAQQEAEAAGAAPGFGKSQVNEPIAADRVRAVVHS